MKDYATLKGALETDARYDAVVRSGENSLLLALLRENHPTRTKYRTVPRKAMLNAIGNGIRTLTADGLSRLRILLSDEQFDGADASLRAEMLDIFAGNSAVLSRIASTATVPQTYAEEFGFESIEKEDLWIVLRQIPKSQLFNYLAGTV